MTKIVFPENYSKVADHVFDYTGLYFGPPDIGKTTLLSQGGNPLFLSFEPGRKALRLKKKEPTGWKNFKDIIDALVEEKNPKFDRVVFDTADLCWDLCERWVCQKLTIDDLADEGWGKGFKKAKAEFSDQILKLLRKGYAVNFISHSIQREVEDDENSKIEVISSTMPASARRVIEGLCDLIVYMKYEKGKRIAIIRGNENLISKCAIEDKFKGVTKIYLGDSKVEAYENFVNAFENGRKEKKIKLGR